MKGNAIEQIRPGSTFETFSPQNEQAGNIALGLDRLANLAIDVIQKGARFNTAKVINLWGGPGRGKTHLIEAFCHKFVNSGLIDKILLFRSDFFRYGADVSVLNGDHPVVVIDDLWSRFQSLNDEKLRDDMHIQFFGDFLAETYEKRRLVLVTSNFPTEGILKRIEGIDQIGRTVSRMREIASKSFELTGDDYREILAEKQNEKDPFKIE